MDGYKQKKIEKKVELALATLLATENFDTITTTKISKTAGVSRSSFYIYFKDKYDVVESYQKRLYKKFETLYIEFLSVEAKRPVLIEIFNLVKQERLFQALMSENGSGEIQAFFKNKFKRLISDVVDQDVSTNLHAYIRQLGLTETGREYGLVFLADALFSYMKNWMARDFRESTEEIVDILICLLPYRIA